ncbi:MAG: RNA 2',3'-cyclic phosphodiesterase [Acidobacteriota bacterium]
MRLFVAFEMPSEVRQALDEHTRAVRSQLPKARWVRPDTIHLTLAFLGETDPTNLPALHRELGAAFASFAPMRLRVEALGAFPPRGKRRVVWAGIGTEGQLVDLQARVAAAVEEALGDAAPEVDRLRFHPHLTLARCKPGWPAGAVERLTAVVGEPAIVPFTVEHGSLVASELRPEGPRYRTIETYPLRSV